MLWLKRRRGWRSPSSAATIATANVVPIITSSMRRSRRREHQADQGQRQIDDEAGAEVLGHPMALITLWSWSRSGPGHASACGVGTSFIASVTIDSSEMPRTQYSGFITMR